MGNPKINYKERQMRKEELEYLPLHHFPKRYDFAFDKNNQEISGMAGLEAMFPIFSNELTKVICEQFAKRDVESTVDGKVVGSKNDSETIRLYPYATSLGEKPWVDITVVYAENRSVIKSYGCSMQVCPQNKAIENVLNGSTD